MLDQEFHESGKLVHERRWVPSERRAEPVSETWWYLNGQMKESIEYATTGDRRTRRDTLDHLTAIVVGILHLERRVQVAREQAREL